MLNTLLHSSRVAVLTILVIQGQTVVAQQCKDGVCSLRPESDLDQLFAPTPRKTPQVNRHRTEQLPVDPFRRPQSGWKQRSVQPTTYPEHVTPNSVRSRDAWPASPTLSPITRRMPTWQTDIHKAARTARATGQPMLIRVTADWCGYCRKMKSEVFSRTKIQKDLAQGFVTVELNADSNRQLVQRLGIQSLPATLILTPEMQIAERMEGYRSAEQLQEKLNRFLPRAELIRDITIALR